MSGGVEAGRRRRTIDVGDGCNSGITDADDVVVVRIGAHILPIRTLVTPQTHRWLLLQQQQQQPIKIN